MKHTSIFNPQINTDDLNKQLLQNLKAGVIDTKFQYIGEKLAQSWLDACQSKEYPHYRNSCALIKDIAPKLADIIKGDINLVCLGTGDGKKEVTLAKEFSKTRKTGFFPVDSSWELIHEALKNSASLDIPKEAFWADIIQTNTIKNIGEHVKRAYFPTNLYTLLGGTICSFPQSLIAKILRDSLKKGDYLLVGFFGRRSSDFLLELKDTADIVDAYKGPSAKKNYSSILELFGLSEKNGEYRIDYGIDSRISFINVIEKKFVFNKDKKIKFMGEEIFFAENENILLGTSCVYSIYSAIRLLESHGLKIVESFENEKGNYMKLLCQLA